MSAAHDKQSGQVDVFRFTFFGKYHRTESSRDCELNEKNRRNCKQMKSIHYVSYFGHEEDLKIMNAVEQKDIRKHSSEEDYKRSVKKAKTSKIDSSFGYMITFAGFINTMLSMSIQNSIGIYYTYMMGEFDIGLTTAAVIGSTNNAIYLGGGVFAVRIVESFGERPVLIFGGFLQFIGCISSSFAPSFSVLFASLSIVNGFGVALSYVAILLSVNKHSYTNRSLSMTLTTLGVSVTSVVFPLIVQTLLQTYDFRGAMLIHSAILLNTVICGAVVFPVKSQGIKKESNVDKNKQLLDMSFCKNSKFLAYLVTNFTLSVGYYIPIGLLPNTALSRGISLDDISLTFSLGGISSILGRILFGFIAHRHPNQTTKLFCFFIIAMGLPMIIIPFSTTFIHYLVFSLINGFFLAFLQDNFGDGGIPYYLGMSILVLSGLVLLPFSSAIKETSTEIPITVPSNQATKRLKCNHLINDIFDPVVSYF